ncbi:hypothetical protein AB0273_002520 [Salmonella enterica]
MESMAEGMIKDLVASGHALADDMTGAPSVLIRCLAAQLEVQLVRANALAAENVGLKYQEPTLTAMMACLEAFYADEDVPERAMMGGYNILRKSVNTPATDAFLDEVRTQARNELITELESRFNEMTETLPVELRGGAAGAAVFVSAFRKGAAL